MRDPGVGEGERSRGRGDDICLAGGDVWHDYIVAAGFVTRVPQLAYDDVSVFCDVGVILGSRDKDRVAAPECFRVVAVGGDAKALRGVL